MNNNKARSREDDGIDITRFFSILFKYRYFIAIFTLFSSIFIFLVVLIAALLPPEISYLPDVYRPNASILVNENPTNTILSTLLSNSSAARNGISFSNFSYGELAIKLLTSKTVMFAIVEEFDVAERYSIRKGKLLTSRGVLMDHLNIEYDEKSMILTLSYEDYDPVFATNIVNRLVNELGIKFNSLDVVRNAGQKQVLESKIAEVLRTIEGLESEIKKFQKKYGFLEVKSLADEQSETVAAVRLKLMNKEIEIKTKQGLLNSDDPEMKKLFAERDSLTRLINEIEGGFSTYKDSMPSQKELPDVVQSFIHIKRELDVQEKIYEILIQQNELTKLSLAGFSPLFQVIDTAEVPDVEYGPARWRICVIGAIISFFAGVFIVVMYNAVKNMLPKIIGKNKGSL